MAAAPLMVSILLIASGVASASDANRAACPNESLTGYLVYLPDCRAYEMVTPPYKDGFSAVQNEAISKDGEHLMVSSLGIFSNPADTGSVDGTYDMQRTSLGWKSVPMDTVFSTFSEFTVLVTNPDFTSSLWIGHAPQQSIPDVYRAISPQGPFASIGPEGPPTLKIGALGLVGASRDLSHSVYRVHAPNLEEVSLLWPGDRTIGVGEVSLYEYSGLGNIEPRLVGVSDEHEVVHIGESHLISECGTFLGKPRGSAHNAISESGATIFFTALGSDHGGCGGLLSGTVEPPVDELYARLNGSRTVAISEPSKADCGECDLSSPVDAAFQGASSDGSKVFFTTTQHLLAGATGGSVNLYEYDFDGPKEGRVTLLSSGDPTGAQVQSVVQVSEDGSHIYFLAQGVLTVAANSFGQQAEENAQNLYVYERDSAHPMGHVMFIAAGGAGTAQATHDGRFLIFESTADLTPDQEGQVEAGQVFEYDAQTGSLVRVSRGQDGYNNDGNTSVYRASIPAQDDGTALSVNEFTKLALSNDGAYVFFTSEDSLAPQALSGVANVYEYHDGNVFLISDGHDLVKIFGAEPAVELLGTNESGRDVFFRTADGLLSQDTDTQLDIYDARVEGGFPLPVVDSGCSGDSCQGPLASAPLQATPPTLSSGGEGVLLVAPKTAVKSKSTLKRSKKRLRGKHVKKHISRGRKATRRR